MLIFLAGVVTFSVTISITPLAVSDGNTQVYIIYAAYLLIPVLLSADFLSLGVRVGRNIEALTDIERSLENVCQQNEPTVAEVMRLVAEYNCVVATGVPIPLWLYSAYHDEIDRIWKK